MKKKLHYYHPQCRKYVDMGGFGVFFIYLNHLLLTLSQQHCGIPHKGWTGQFSLSSATPCIFIHSSTAEYLQLFLFLPHKSSAIPVNLHFCLQFIPIKNLFHIWNILCWKKIKLEQFGKKESKAQKKTLKHQLKQQNPRVFSAY